MAWSYLKPGDVVDVVAPGFSFNKKDLENSCQRISQWGLVPRYPKNILGRDLICSNSVENRWEHFHEALFTADSRAVWFIRGGYGSIHLVEKLAKVKPPKREKAILGLSDVTSIHWFLNQQWGWSTLHSPLFSYIGRERSPKVAVNEVRNVIFGKDEEIEFINLKPLNHHARKKMIIKSKIIGGNFTVATSLIGTPYFAGKGRRILFLEDIGERAYRLDRLFRQWLLSGSLKKIDAIIFGQMTESEDPDGKNRSVQWMENIAQEMKIPVFKNLQSGHGKVQRTVPLNTSCTLEGGDKGKLIVQCGGKHGRA